MDELRQMKRKRRRLDTQALRDHAGRQPRRPAGDQEAEQRRSGFLGQRAEGCNRSLVIHNPDFLCFNDRQIMP
jgi:hypothetical protein